MRTIEVEVRSFITLKKYELLLEFFNKNGQLVKDDYQETYYFDAPKDLRIQRNKKYSKVWLKEGQIHDDCREEIEIKFCNEEFEKLENIFESLGYPVNIKWFRTRKEFIWDSIKVCLDHTKGYGFIIELEKQCERREQEEILADLKNKLKSLGLTPTSKTVFNKKFEYYKNNWQKLTR